jgi:hypothetical protein
VRTDDTPFEARVVVRAKGCEAPLVPAAPGSKDRWGLARAALGCALQSGDVLALEVTAGSLHDFHAWLVQEKR